MNIRLHLALFAAAAALAAGSAALAQEAAAPAQAPAAAPAAKPKYSVATSSLAELARDPKTKPILAKHLSAIWDQVEANIDQIPPEFTLQSLADFAQGAVTADDLKAIDAELAKL